MEQYQPEVSAILAILGVPSKHTHMSYCKKGLTSLVNFNSRQPDQKEWSMSNMCHLCKSQGESTLHMFHTCSYTKQVLLLARGQSQLFDEVVGRQSNRYDDILFESKNIKQRQIQLTICFVIWREILQNLSENSKTSEYSTGRNKK